MTDVVSEIPAQRDSGDGGGGSAAGAAKTGAHAAPVASPVSPASPGSPASPASPVSPGSTVSPATSPGEQMLGERVNEVVQRAGDAMERAAAASGRVASQVVERLRNNAELAAERGTTTIANEVVEKITGIAAREVPGVYDLGGDVARVFAAVKERIGLGDTGEDSDRGVSVRLEGRAAVINITIVIEFGFVVHSVTEAVRVKVINSVENLLGLEVSEVNILVDDVHVPDSGPVGNDETRAVGYQP